MSSLATQTRQLERVIRRKEKIFLMEQYATAMLQQLEPKAEEGQADEQVIDALRIAYRYVNPELGDRLSALLLAYGYSGDLEAEREAAEEAEEEEQEEQEEQEQEEEEQQQPQPKKGRAQSPATGPAAQGEEDEEAGVLFERDIYTGRKRAEKGKQAATADGEENAADLFADEDGATADADDLFADADADSAEEEDSGAARKKKGKTQKPATGEEEGEEEDTTGLFADDDDAKAADDADLFADDADADSPEEGDDPKPARKKKDKKRKAVATEEEEEDAGLFADDDDAKAADAADLFADDAEDADSPEEEGDPKTARKKKDKRKKTTAADEDTDTDAADLFADDAEDSPEEDDDSKTARKKKRKKKRSAATDEDADADLVSEALDESAEAPRRFKPTQGHEWKETPGFAAPEGAVERDEKSRRGYELYAPDEKAEKAPDPKAKTRKPPRSIAEDEDEEEEAPTPARKGRPGGRTALEEEDEAEEVKEPRPRRPPRVAADEDKGENKKAGKDTQAADPKNDEKKLNLDALTYQVSIEDLHTHMGISLVREDHVKLIRRWEQKSRDNSIRLLLDDPKATQHPYALVPRITRYIKDGQMIQVNVLNLVRHFFQLFENVPQVIQLKNEPFFVTEVPTLEWAVVACEALPDTLNKTVLEQRTIFSHYIQKFMSNERRVRRRVLVEALYDIIVLNMVCKEPILRKTVDLTETRRGRQHQLCVNFGAKGIRINSVTRDQRHPQMGMCPSW